MTRFGAEGGFPSDQHRQQPADRRDVPDPSTRQARTDLTEDRQQRNETNQRNDNNQTQQRQQGVDDPSTRASRPELPAQRNAHEQPIWTKPSDLGPWGKPQYERPEHHREAPVKKDGGPASPPPPGITARQYAAMVIKDKADRDKATADVQKHADDKPRKF